MIKNKRISKITMLTCLMLGGIVNAQEFYTCVPKKSWWVDSVAEGIIEEKKRTEKEICLKEKKKCEENNIEKENCFQNCYYDLCMFYEDEQGRKYYKKHDKHCERDCRDSCGRLSNCGKC